MDANKPSKRLRNSTMNEEIPIGSNHPDATPLKQEEPDDWFSDKPVPIWTFGDRLVYSPPSSSDERAIPFRKKPGDISEVIGLVWLPHEKGHSWWYCLAAISCNSKGGIWHSEPEVQANWLNHE
jgi:hypothetical protein